MDVWQRDYTRLPLGRKGSQEIQRNSNRKPGDLESRISHTSRDGEWKHGRLTRDRVTKDHGVFVHLLTSSLDSGKFTLTVRQTMVS